MADRVIRPYNHDYDDNSYDHYDHDNDHHYDHDNNDHDNDDCTPRDHDNDNGSVVHVFNYDCGGASHVDL